MNTNINTAEGNNFIFYKKEKDLSRTFKEEARFIRSKDHLLIAVTEKENNLGEKYKGYFAYELECCCSDNAKDIDPMVSATIKWHVNLLYSLKNISIPVSYTLFFSNPEKRKSSGVKIILLVKTFSGNKEGIDYALKALAEKGRIFFQPKNRSRFFPFVFSQVTDRIALQELIRKENDNSYKLFHKPVIKLKQTSSVGFKQEDKQFVSASYLPMHCPKSDLPMDSFLSILSETDDPTEIRISLTPTKLNSSETDRIKRIIARPGIIANEFNSQEEIEDYIDYCKNIVERNLPLFSIKVSSLNNPSHTILNELISAFGVTDEESDNNTTPNDETDFRHLYPQTEAIYSWRFPFPQEEGIIGIRSSHPAFHSAPDKFARKGILLGEKQIGNKIVPVRISPDDLAHHLYLLGQTGVGKTTMLKTVIRNLVSNKNSEGIALVDCHGDVIKSVLETIPKEREKDIILFDPTSILDSNLRINILEFDISQPEQKTFIANELMKIMNELWDMKLCGGPMFEHYLKSFLWLVMDTIGGTLADVVKAFEDKEFRDVLLSGCDDEELSNRIRQLLITTGDSHFDNVIPYLTSKLTRFTLDHFLKPIISERKSNIDFRKIMDEKKILLVRIPKGRLGDEGVKFLGTIILNRIILAAYSRENIPEKERIPFTLFIDEMQNYMSSDIASALAEARKFSLRIVCASQSFEQLDKKILTSLLGSVANLIAFRPGIQDAGNLEAYFHKIFSAKDLLELPNYFAVARLLINNAPSKPFTFKTKK